MKCSMDLFATSARLYARSVKFNSPILAPLDSDFEWESSPVILNENGQELAKLPGE